MSDKKYSENDPERTLLTLDQLSQTIEVMTNVVNRLRQHLSEQLIAKREAEMLRHQPGSATTADEEALRADRDYDQDDGDELDVKESFIVEITQTEREIPEDEVLH
ncbi:MAG: hypothetical protein WDZ76_09750 [Pseudohongiellaceae bacterium]